MKSDKVFRLEAALQVAIMLVDDEPDFQDIIAKRLKRMGIALIQADCCDTAMLQLESHAMGVVIMDVNMPGIDGIKCLRKVKKQQPVPSLQLFSWTTGVRHITIHPVQLVVVSGTGKEERRK